MFEPLEAGNEFRREYIDALEALIDARREENAVERYKYYRENFKTAPEIIRAKLKQKLGWPLTENPSEIEKINKTLVCIRDGISIYRVQLFMRGIPFYGMLFVNEDGKKRPLVLAVHGGLGTPEVVGGMLECGTDNYAHFVERLNALGANVFAPQLLIWEPERFKAREKDLSGDVNAMRRPRDSALQQTGSSITAIEIYAMSRAIDWLDNEPFTQKGCIGITGLSYGGFYSMYMAAIDTRIRAALTSCSFNDRWHGSRIATDYIWGDSGRFFCDAEIALLIYPRRLMIQVGDHDQILSFEGAKREFKRFKLLADELTEGDWYKFDAFDGRHEFSPDDGCLKWLIESCQI